MEEGSYSWLWEDRGPLGELARCAGRQAFNFAMPGFGVAVVRRGA